MKIQQQDLFQILQSHTEPLALSEILPLLKDPVPERTLRRWLKEFSKEGKIEVLGQYKTQKYQIADAVKSPRGYT